MKSTTRPVEHGSHSGQLLWQDFYAAFGLGETDKYIAQGDAQGVALASIQGLYQLVQQKNQQLQESLAEKDEKIQALENRLAALEKLILNK